MLSELHQLSTAAGKSNGMAVPEVPGSHDLPSQGASMLGWSEVTKEVLAALAVAEGAEVPPSSQMAMISCCVSKAFLHGHVQAQPGQSCAALALAMLAPAVCFPYARACMHAVLWTSRKGVGSI